MIEIDRVRKGLKCHAQLEGCDECPYTDLGEGCSAALAKDAYSIFDYQIKQIKHSDKQENKTIRCANCKEYEMHYTVVSKGLSPGGTIIFQCKRGHCIERPDFYCADFVKR